MLFNRAQLCRINEEYIMKITTSLSMIFLIALLATPLSDLALAKGVQANDDMGVMYGLVLGNRITL